MGVETIPKTWIKFLFRFYKKLIAFVKLRLKWFLFWLCGVTGAIQFLLSGKKPKEGLVILCYHRIAENLPFWSLRDPCNVQPRRFKHQVDQCRKIKGQEVVSATKVRNWLNDGKVPKGSYLLFTFDDGYKNTLYAASKLYKEGFPGVVFLATAFLDKNIFEGNAYDMWLKENESNQENYQPLTTRDCQLLLNMGMEIQPHSHTHKNMGQLEIDEVTDEIVNSKKVIADFGVEPDIAFAYPYGGTRLGEVTPTVEEQIKESGFGFAVSTDAGVNSPGNIYATRYKLKRIPIQNFDKGLIFQSKAAGYSGLLPCIKKLAHEIAMRGKQS